MEKGALTQEFIDAMSHRKWDDAMRLADGGADVRLYDDKALTLAAESGQAALIEKLLQQGCDANARFTEALQRAVDGGHHETAKTLLDGGADVNAQNGEALRLASENGDLDMIRLLVNRGADVHKQDDTAVYHAATWGHGEAVCLLLKAGAYMERAAAEAKRRGNEELSKRLADWPAYWKADNRERFTAWLDEQPDGAPDFLASVDVINTTPLKMAAEGGCLDKVFAPKLWENRIDAMKALWQQVSDEHKQSFDFEAAVQDVRRLSLRRGLKNRKNRLQR